MNNEETILDPQYNSESQTQSASEEQNQSPEKKGMGWGEKAAYAAGGAVVGAGVTFAGQAVAAKVAASMSEEEQNPETAEGEEATEGKENVTDAKPEEITATETPEAKDEVSAVTVEANDTTVHVSGDAKVDIENGSVHVTTSATQSQDEQSTDVKPELVDEQHTAPEPEDSIVATATGVRVAHVDDSASFSQAFADARAQVGPGGVFEWHGRVYGTYYKDEWDNMSAEQKHNYQTSIDYRDVVSEDSLAQHQTSAPLHESAAIDDNAHRASYQLQETTTEQDATDDVQGDIEVQVLDTGQIDLDDDGATEDAALLEVNGHEVLIVDIDHDGMADAAFYENDGEIETADLTGEDIAMPVQTSAGDDYMAQADNTPDYVNDANVGIYEV